MLDKSLQTERLILRLLRFEDIPEITKMHTDPEVMRLSGAGGILDEVETKKCCQGILEHWKIHGYGMYVLEAKEDGTFYGFVGLRHLPDYPAPELSFILPRSKWGQGYATEAAKTVRDHAFQKLGCTEIYHFMDSRNEKAVKLAKRLGAVLRKEMVEEIDEERVIGVMYVLKSER